MKNIRRILVLVMVVMASVLAMAGCGDPYKDLKLIIDDGGFENALDRRIEYLGDSEVTEFEITSQVTGASDKVSTDVIYTIQDKALIEMGEKVVDGNVSTQKFVLKGTGKTCITVSTLEGSRSEDVWITSFANPTGMQFLADETPIIKGQKTNVCEVVSGFKKALLSFEPGYATECDVTLEVVGEGKDDVDINGNTVTVLSDSKLTGFRLKATLKCNNKTAFTNVKVLEPIVKENINLQYASRHEELGDSASVGYVDLEKNPSSDSDFVLYLAEQTSGDEKRDAKNIYLKTEEMKGNYTFTLNTASGKHTTIFTSTIEGKNGYAITNGDDVGNSDIYSFTVNYSGYEQFFAGVEVKVKVVISSFPAKVYVDSSSSLINVNATETIYIFNNYDRKLGTPFYVKVCSESNNVLKNQEAYVGVYDKDTNKNATPNVFTIYNTDGRIVSPGITKVKSGDVLYIKFDAGKINFAGDYNDKYVLYAYSAIDNKTTSLINIGTESNPKYNGMLNLTKDYLLNTLTDLTIVLDKNNSQVSLDLNNGDIPLDLFEVTSGDLVEKIVAKEENVDVYCFTPNGDRELGQTYYTVVAPNGYTVTHNLFVTKEPSASTSFSLIVGSHEIGAGNSLHFNMDVNKSYDIYLKIDGVKYTVLPPNYLFSIKYDEADKKLNLEGWQKIKSLGTAHESTKYDVIEFLLSYAGDNTSTKSFTLNISVIKPIRSIVASNSFVTIGDGSIKDYNPSTYQYATFNVGEKGIADSSGNRITQLGTTEIKDSIFTLDGSGNAVGVTIDGVYYKFVNDQFTFYDNLSNGYLNTEDSKTIYYTLNPIDASIDLENVILNITINNDDTVLELSDDDDKKTGSFGQNNLSFNYALSVENNSNRIKLEITDIDIKKDQNNSTDSIRSFDIRLDYKQTYILNSNESYNVLQNNVDGYYITKGTDTNAQRVTSINGYPITQSCFNVENEVLKSITIGNQTYEVENNQFTYDRYAIIIPCVTAFKINKQAVSNSLTLSGIAVGDEYTTGADYSISFNKNQIANDMQFGFSYYATPNVLDKPGVTIYATSGENSSFTYTETETFGGKKHLVSLFKWENGKLLGIQSNPTWTEATGLSFFVDFNTNKVTFTIKKVDAFSSYLSSEAKSSFPYILLSVVTLDTVNSDNKVAKTIRISLNTGTASNPYKIYDAKSFQAINLDLEAYYKVQNDISLFSADGWTPIGTSGNHCKAKITTVNGEKFRVFGLNGKVVLSDSNVKHIGIFGYLNGAEISNLSFEDINLEIYISNAYTGDELYVGLLAGEINNATLSNITISDSSTVNYDAYAGIERILSGNFGHGIRFVNGENAHTERLIVYAGGLAGKVTQLTGTIEKVSVSIDINDTKNHTYYVGGLAGQTSCGLSNCDVKCIITSYNTHSETYLGGVFGTINGVLTLQNINSTCYIYTTGGNAGGIAGGIISGSVKIKDGTVSPFIYGANYASNIGGVVGVLNSGTTITNVKVKFLNRKSSDGYYTASIIGSDNVGGIVGNATSSFTITNSSVFSYAIADEGEVYWGDIVLTNRHINNNTQNVIEHRGGGMVGQVKGAVPTISKSYFYGTIYSQDGATLGGLIGVLEVPDYRIDDTTVSGNIYHVGTYSNNSTRTSIVGNFIGAILNSTTTKTNSEKLDSNNRYKLKDNFDKKGFNIADSYSVLKAKNLSDASSQLDYLQGFVGSGEKWRVQNYNQSQKYEDVVFTIGSGENKVEFYADMPAVLAINSFYIGFESKVSYVGTTDPITHTFSENGFKASAGITGYTCDFNYFNSSRYVYAFAEYTKVSGEGDLPSADLLNDVTTFNGVYTSSTYRYDETNENAFFNETEPTLTNLTKYQNRFLLDGNVIPFEDGDKQTGGKPNLIVDIAPSELEAKVTNYSASDNIPLAILKYWSESKDAIKNTIKITNFVTISVKPTLASSDCYFESSDTDVFAVVGGEILLKGEGMATLRAISSLNTNCYTEITILVLNIDYKDTDWHLVDERNNKYLSASDGKFYIDPFANNGLTLTTLIGDTATASSINFKTEFEVDLTSVKINEFINYSKIDFLSNLLIGGKSIPNNKLNEDSYTIVCDGLQHSIFSAYVGEIEVIQRIYFEVTVGGETTKCYLKSNGTNKKTIVFNFKEGVFDITGSNELSFVVVNRENFIVALNCDSNKFNLVLNAECNGTMIDGDILINEMDKEIKFSQYECGQLIIRLDSYEYDSSRKLAIFKFVAYVDDEGQQLVNENQNYVLTFMPCISENGETDKFDGLTHSVNVTLSQQNVESINITHFTNILYETDAKPEGTASDPYKYPSDIIIPGYTSLLQVDFYPSFGYYDYIEITTDSNLVTISQVVELINTAQGQDDLSRYEAYEDQSTKLSNGIRISGRVSTRDLNKAIQKQYAYNGSMFVSISADSKLSGDKLTLAIKGYQLNNPNPLFEEDAVLSIEAWPGIEVTTSAQEVTFGGKVPLNITVQNTQDSFDVSLKASYSDAELIGSLGDVLYDQALRSYVLVIRDTKYVYVNYTDLMYQDLILTFSVTKSINGYLATQDKEINIRLVPYIIDSIQLGLDGATPDNGKYIVSYYQGYNLKIKLNCTYSEGYYNYLLINNPSGSIRSQIEEFENYIADNMAQYGLLSQGVENNRRTLLDVNKSSYTGEFALNFDATTSTTMIRFIGYSVSNFLWAEIGVEYSNRGIGLVNKIANPRLVFTSAISFVVDTSSEDENPDPITSVQNLLDMRDGSYILLRDLYLVNWSPLDVNFKSFDGNGYIITIMSFASEFETSEGGVNIGLFKSIPENTIVKNVTIEVVPYTGYTGFTDEVYANGTFASELTNTVKKDANIATTISNTSLSVDISSLSEVNFGLLAGENNGILTNIQIVRDATKIRTARNNAIANKTDSDKVNITYGDNFDDLTNILNGNLTVNPKVSVKAITETETTNKGDNIGLIVGTNNGYITNSSVTNTDLNSQEYTGGLVGYNAGNAKISSSFFKGGNIVHTGNVQANTGVGGLVARNAGVIAYSYVQGATGETEGSYPTESVRAKGSYIETFSFAGGFAYQNTGTISNCYSNILLKGSSAGFVYLNEEATSIVEYCHSLSAILLQNDNYYPFVKKSKSGLDTVTDGFYLYNAGFATMDKDSGVSIDSVNNFGDYNAFVGYSFNADYYMNELVENAVWFIPSGQNTELTELFKSDTDITTAVPQLVSANLNTLSVRYMVQKRSSSDAYTYNYATSIGVVSNPILIDSAETFNKSIGNTNKSAGYGTVVSSDETRNYRFISDISFTRTDEVGTTYNTNFKGKLDGNGMTIKNLRLTAEAIDETANVKKLGLFATIQGRLDNNEMDYAVVKNLNIEVAQIDGTNVNIVGVLAGEISNATISNINISGDSVVVQGQNAVGGVAGLIYGDSDIVNLTSSISVRANYYSQINPFDYEVSYTVEQSDFDKFVGQSTLYAPVLPNTTTNSYSNDVSDNIKEVSYAGGIAGICLIAKKDPAFVTDVKLATLYTNLYRARRLYLNGTPEIQAEVVGGIFGYLSENSNLSDCDIVVNQGMKFKSSRLAGGLIGHNLGEIKRCTIENADQDTIDNAISKNPTAYDNAKTDVYTGVDDLYGGTSTEFKAMFAGGLVGFLHKGRIEKSYNRVNVASLNSLYAGGLVGLSLLGTSLESVYTTASVQSYVAYGGVFGYVAEKVGCGATFNEDNNTYFFNIGDNQNLSLGSSGSITLRGVMASNIWKISHLNTNRKSSMSPNATPAKVGMLVGKLWLDFTNVGATAKIQGVFGATKSLSDRVNERVLYKATYNYTSVVNSLTQKTALDEVGEMPENSLSYNLFSDISLGNLYTNKTDEYITMYSQNTTKYSLSADEKKNIQNDKVTIDGITYDVNYTDNKTGAYIYNYKQANVTPYTTFKVGESEGKYISALFRKEGSKSVDSKNVNSGTPESDKVYMLSRLTCFGALRSLGELVNRKTSTSDADAFYKAIGAIKVEGLGSESELSKLLGTHYFKTTTTETTNNVTTTITTYNIITKVTSQTNYPATYWDEKVWSGIKYNEVTGALTDSECVFPKLRNSLDTWSNVYVYSAEDLTNNLETRNTATFVLMNDIYLKDGQGGYCYSKPFRGTIRSAQIGDIDGGNVVKNNFVFTIFNLSVTPIISNSNNLTSVGGLIGTAIGATFENFNLHVVKLTVNNKANEKTVATGVLVGKALTGTSITNVQILGSGNSIEAPNVSFDKSNWVNKLGEGVSKDKLYIYAHTLDQYANLFSGNASVETTNVEFVGGYVGLAKQIKYSYASDGGNTVDVLVDCSSFSIKETDTIPDIQENDKNTFVIGVDENGEFIYSNNNKDIKNPYIGKTQVANINFKNTYYGTLNKADDDPAVVSYMGGYFGLASLNFADEDKDKCSFTVKNCTFDYALKISKTIAEGGSNNTIQKFNYNTTFVDNGVYVGAVAGKLDSQSIKGNTSGITIYETTAKSNTMNVNVGWNNGNNSTNAILDKLYIGVFGKLESINLTKIITDGTKITYNNGYTEIIDVKGVTYNPIIKVTPSGANASKKINEYIGGVVGSYDNSVVIGNNSNVIQQDVYSTSTTITVESIFGSSWDLTTYVGGFVGKTTTGTIQNVVLRGFKIDIKSATAEYVGGLVGAIDDDIVNCYANGEINYTQNMSVGSMYLGGLVGSSKGAINGSYVNVDINAEVGQNVNHKIGGVAGISSSSTTAVEGVTAYGDIRIKSYFNNDAFDGGYLKVGGLIGEYGFTAFENDISGLFGGSIQVTSSELSTKKTIYEAMQLNHQSATPSVTSNGEFKKTHLYIGGIVGSNSKLTSNSKAYYNTDLVMIDNGIGIGKTTKELLNTDYSITNLTKVTSTPTYQALTTVENQVNGVVTKTLEYKNLENNGFYVPSSFIVDSKIKNIAYGEKAIPAYYVKVYTDTKTYELSNTEAIYIKGNTALKIQFSNMFVIGEGEENKHASKFTNCVVVDYHFSKTVINPSSGTFFSNCSAGVAIEVNDCVVLGMKITNEGLDGAGNFVVYGEFNYVNIESKTNFYAETKLTTQSDNTSNNNMVNSINENKKTIFDSAGVTSTYTDGDVMIEIMAKLTNVDMKNVFTVIDNKLYLKALLKTRWQDEEISSEYSWTEFAKENDPPKPTKTIYVKQNVTFSSETKYYEEDILPYCYDHKTNTWTVYSPYQLAYMSYYVNKETYNKYTDTYYNKSFNINIYQYPEMSWYLVKYGEKLDRRNGELIYAVKELVEETEQYVWYTLNAPSTGTPTKMTETEKGTYKVANLIDSNGKHVKNYYLGDTQGLVYTGEFDMSGKLFDPFAMFQGTFDGGGVPITGLNIVTGGSAGFILECNTNNPVSLSKIYLKNGYIYGNNTVGGLVANVTGSLSDKNILNIEKVAIENMKLFSRDASTKIDVYIGSLVGCDLKYGYYALCRVDENESFKSLPIKSDAYAPYINVKNCYTTTYQTINDFYCLLFDVNASGSSVESAYMALLDSSGNIDSCNMYFPCQNSDPFYGDEGSVDWNRSSEVIAISNENQSSYQGKNASYNMLKFAFKRIDWKVTTDGTNNNLPKLIFDTQYWIDFAKKPSKIEDPERTNGIVTTKGKIEITSAEELAWIAYECYYYKEDKFGGFGNYEIILKNNIDLAGKLWSSIGKEIYVPFGGTFDGNGKTISNMICIRDSYFSKSERKDNVGLFRYTGTATIKNFTLKDPFVQSTDELQEVAFVSCCTSGTIIDGVIINGGDLISYSKNTGGIVGFSYEVTIIGCEISNSTNITTYNNADDSYCGGFVGWSQNDLTIMGSVFEGKISGNVNYLGGFVGRVAPRDHGNCLLQNNHFGGKLLDGKIKGLFVGEKHEGDLYVLETIITLDEESWLGFLVGKSTESLKDPTNNIYTKNIIQNVFVSYDNSKGDAVSCSNISTYMEGVQGYYWNCNATDSTEYVMNYDNYANNSTAFSQFYFASGGGIDSNICRATGNATLSYSESLTIRDSGTNIMYDALTGAKITASKELPVGWICGYTGDYFDETTDTTKTGFVPFEVGIKNNDMVFIDSALKQNQVAVYVAFRYASNRTFDIQYGKELATVAEGTPQAIGLTSTYSIGTTVFPYCGTATGVDNYIIDYSITGVYGGNHRVAGGSKATQLNSGYAGGIAKGGLFGYAESATFKNLKIQLNGTNYDGKDTDTNSYFGLVANYADGCTFNGCSVQSGTTNTIYTYSAHFGGIVGYALNSSITSCALTNIDITLQIAKGSSGALGGIVGDYAVGNINQKELISSCILTNCRINTRNTSTTMYIGGIVGQAGTGSTVHDICYEVEGCVVNGGSILTRKGYVGGIVGYVYSSSSNDYIRSKISNNTNKAAIESLSPNYIGGIVGYITRGVVSNNINNGNVCGSEGVGGIMGYASCCSVTSNSNNGKIFGSELVGGIVGYITHPMIYDGKYVYGNSNYGNIVGVKGEVGGIIGYIHSNISMLCDITNNFVGFKQNGGEIIKDTTVKINDIKDINDFCKHQSIVKSGYECLLDIDKVGGLIGRANIRGQNSKKLATISYNKINVEVNGRNEVGGTIGYLEGINIGFSNNQLHATVYGYNSTGGWIGGLVKSFAISGTLAFERGLNNGETNEIFVYGSRAYLGIASGADSSPGDSKASLYLYNYTNGDKCQLYRYGSDDIKNYYWSPVVDGFFSDNFKSLIGVYMVKDNNGKDTNNTFAINGDLSYWQYPAGDQRVVKPIINSEGIVLLLYDTADGSGSPSEYYIVKGMFTSDTSDDEIASGNTTAMGKWATTSESLLSESDTPA